MSRCTSVMQKRLLMLGFLVLFASSGFARAEDDWQPWDEAVFQEVARQYGPAAEQRMRLLHQFVADNYHASEMEKVVSTNTLANNLPWIADRNLYHQDDYWATPLETITTFGGDCEDIAITKLVILRALGVPAEKLRLAHVEIIRTGEAHMVLAYNENPDLPPGKSRIYVLDNFIPSVLEHTKRTDLKVLYTVDSNKNVHIISDQNGQRTVVKTVDDAKYGKIDKIIQQIAENRAHYQALNGGRPLL